MKSILSIMFCALINVSAISQDFKTEFRKIFTSSIKGLESAKGVAVGGGWATAEKLTGYTNATIKKDDDLGVLYIQFSIVCSSEEEGKKLMATKEAEVMDALPAGQYNKTSTYDMDFIPSMKTLFEFNSQKMADLQKRPSLEMGLIDDNGRVLLVLNLFEPYFKNQYTPQF